MPGIIERMFMESEGASAFFEPRPAERNFRIPDLDLIDAKYNRRRQRVLHQTRIIPKVDAYLIPNRVGGDVTLENIYRELENLIVIERENNDGNDLPLRHREIFDTMTTSILPKIYKTDYEANITRLMKRFDKHYFREASLVCLPRRHGKTIISAIWCAVVGKAITITCNIYSSVFNQSQMFQDAVVKYLGLLGANFKSKKGKITIFNNEGGKSIFNFYSAYHSTSDVRMIFIYLGVFICSSIRFGRTTARTGRRSPSAPS